MRLQRLAVGAAVRRAHCRVARRRAVPFDAGIRPDLSPHRSVTPRLIAPIVREEIARLVGEK